MKHRPPESLDEKIHSLVPEVDEYFRLTLRQLLSVLREIGDYRLVLNGLQAPTQELMNRAITLKGYTGEYKKTLQECKNKAINLQLFSEAMVENLEVIRVHHNMADHDPNFNPDLAMTVETLERFLSILEWFYIKYRHGPRHPSIYPKYFAMQGRIIGLPPLRLEGLFKDRVDAYAELNKLILDRANKFICIVGRGGIGKTALLGKLCTEIEYEVRRLPKRSETAADGMVYLSCKSASESIMVRLFADAGAMLGEPHEKKLEACWNDSHRSMDDKIRFLLAQFGHDDYVIVLDNLESLLAPEDNTLTDPAFRQFVELSMTTSNNLRFVGTSRERLNLSISSRGVRYYSLEDGLPTSDAVALLQELDTDGDLRLKQAPTELLEEVGQRCFGIPQALDLVARIMGLRPTLTLQKLLNNSDLFGEKVVQNLLDEQYRRLSEEQRQILQAFAVYDIPMPAAALEWVADVHFPHVNLDDNLSPMVRNYFVKSEPGTEVYELHPLDQQYAYERMPIELRAEIHETIATYFLKKLDEYAAQDTSETSFQRFTRYETVAWQVLSSEWLRHSAKARNRTRIYISLTHLYFEAFWWWEEYLPFPFCKEILKKWASSQMQAEDQEFLGLIQQFHQTFPRKWTLDRSYQATHWKQSVDALKEIRRRLDCERELEKEDIELLGVKALTTAYLADLHGMRSENEEHRNLAEAYYEETARLFAQQPDYQWSQSYILYEFAEFWNNAGDYVKGLKTCCLAYAKIEPEIHEPETRIFRIAGDACWNLCRYTDAWLCYKIAFWEVYCYQGWYQDMAHDPDPYTVKLYDEILERIVRRLREYAEIDFEATADTAVDMHDFWLAYWCVSEPDETSEADRETVALWILDGDERLKHYLGPLIPEPAEAVYSDRVRQLSQEMKPLLTFPEYKDFLDRLYTDAA